LRIIRNSARHAISNRLLEGGRATSSSIILRRHS
jgi:hypothetical protein